MPKVTQLHIQQTLASSPKEPGFTGHPPIITPSCPGFWEDFLAEAGLRAEAGPHSFKPAPVSVAKALGKSGQSSRPRSWEAGTLPGLPRSCVWPWYNEGFVSAVPAPTLFGKSTPPSSCAPSSLLSGRGWEGDGICTWMELTVSGEAKASHSSRTEVEVAFPLLGQDLAD